VRVCILGNSVAFRIRPPRDPARPDERTYAEWLMQDGHEVLVAAGAGILLTEAFATVDDRVVSWFPDVVILNFGVVELAHRQTPRWLNNRTIVNYYLNDVFARPYEFDTPASRSRLAVWRGLNATARRLNSLLGFKWQWLPHARFLIVLEHTIQVILKETAARVIVLGVAPSSDRVERILGGSVDAFRVANEEMAALATRYADRVKFLSAEEYLGGGSPDLLVPDGVHFSAAGHRAAACAIRSAIGDVAPRARAARADVAS
jgi:lysophospholipase L1-like esterase